MATYPILCGNCAQHVAASILEVRIQCADGALWLVCPHCGHGSVRSPLGAVFPTAPQGANVRDLPTDVEIAWREARTAHAVAAYTASEIMCRKILMHLAVDKAGSDAGKSFVQYVNDLESTGYIMAGLKPVVDKIRGRGNVANHELPASTEQDSLATLTITQHLLQGIYELPSMP